jgi:hypothetical protein
MSYKKNIVLAKEDQEIPVKEIMKYNRSQEEFIEMFQYGKVYRLLNVSEDGQKADAHRMYLLKDRNPIGYRIQPSSKRYAITIPGFAVKEHDMLFYSTDGSPSILRGAE